MLLIKNGSTDPYFNMACEEFLLDYFKEPVIMLWRNAPAVIIGRNQNALEELNLDFAKEHSIAVVRRLTGGGAVFHDLGNINFTMIVPHCQEQWNDYAGFCAPVLEFLRSIGVYAAFSGRNDMTIDGLKFSGNAQTVRNGRMMHHGTLLYSADLSRLSGVLKPKEAKISSKGIKSVRSRVINIAEKLEAPFSAEEFMNRLFAFFLQSGGTDSRIYNFAPKDKEKIECLAKDKYHTWEWTIGNAPKYNFEKSHKFEFGLVEVRLDTEKSIIKSCRIQGDFFGVFEVSLLEQKLCSIPHTREAIEKVLSGVCISDYISHMTTEQLIDLMI